MGVQISRRESQSVVEQAHRSARAPTRPAMRAKAGWLAAAAPVGSSAGAEVGVVGGCEVTVTAGLVTTSVWGISTVVSGMRVSTTVPPPTVTRTLEY